MQLLYDASFHHVKLDYDLVDFCCSFHSFLVSADLRPQLLSILFHIALSQCYLHGLGRSWLVGIWLWFMWSEPLFNHNGEKIIAYKVPNIWPIQCLINPCLKIVYITVSLSQLRPQLSIIFGFWVEICKPYFERTVDHDLVQHFSKNKNQKGERD